MKNNKIWFEKINNNVGQFFKINKIILKKKTKYQNIFIFENKKIGKILAIDNIVQTTSYDEFIYHEMICLIPILSHENPKNILIIGGGDGGCLKEIIKIKCIKKITLVELDKKIIKYSKKYLKEIHQDSFYNKKVKIIIDDGFKFIQKNKKKFDIIIIDSTDAIGPGKILFSEEFYNNCKISLKKNGIIVGQNGTYIYQKKNIVNNIKIFKKLFKFSGLYQAPIPTYYGGNMFFIWGSNNTNLKKINLNYLNKQLPFSKFKYYNSSIHINSFYLPQFLLNKLNIT